MKIQKLVYSRPNLIRSQVGSVLTFACMLQFRIFFFLQLVYVLVQCRQKVKLNNANVHSSILAEHERECYNYVCVQFSVNNKEDF